MASEIAWVSAPGSDPATPTKPQAAASSRAHFQRWEDLRIVFISDERVQIWNGNEHETYNYTEMGFADRRTGAPSKPWHILRTLAQSDGLISAEARTKVKGWPALEKQLERTGKLLKSHFGLTYNPIIFEKGRGYRLRCKIECDPSFHT